MKGRARPVARARTLAAILGLVVWSMVLSAPSAAATLSISGKVTDSMTSAAVSGVCITVGVPGNFCWTTTNSQGNYFVDLGAQGAQSGTEWELFFIKGGYTTTSSKKVVDGNETMNVSMTPDGTPISTTPPPPCTFPPVPGCAFNPPPDAPPLPSFTVYLPNITKTLGGPTGWHTPFIVQNVGTESTSLMVAFYGFASGELVATRNATVLPGRSFVDSPRDEADLPDNSQFSVVITSTGAPVVAVVNEHQGPGAGNEALSYSGIGTGATKVFLPLVAKMKDGWLTTMIMQNVGSAQTTVTASFVSLDGTQTAAVTRTIDPGRSAFIDPRVEANLSDGVEYSATMTSSEPIAVVTNNHHDLPGTLPAMGDSYNGVAAGATTTYLPYIAKNTDGVGRTSRVVVQNAGVATATPTITLYPFGGGASSTVTAPPIASGASFAFTPAGADGEYSAKITGGTFVAVATAISTETAMYYTGTSGAQTKLFIPNVTRRLTADPAVDPGWNTPIIIQSATALSATLSWYRFSDGTLVTTQSVTLAADRSVRVDPAAVAGLSDNSQYSVVLESGGTVVAIVTELNLVGGDDAMVYKGFAAP